MYVDIYKESGRPVRLRKCWLAFLIALFAIIYSGKICNIIGDCI